MLAKLNAEQLQIGVKVLSALNIPLPLISTVMAAVNGNTLIKEDGSIDEDKVDDLLAKVTPLLPWNSNSRRIDVQTERLVACKCCTTINKVKI